MEYILIKSKRKTLSLSVNEKLQVVLRAPIRASKKEIDAFFQKNRGWIEKQIEKEKKKAKELEEETPIKREDLERLKQDAKSYFEEKAGYFAGRLGVSYNKVTIKALKSRWGSCSTKKNLNFNCLLMLLDEGVRDAVAAHEVCHLKEMNHSKRFYRMLYQLCPDYDRHNMTLKTEGRRLIARMEKGEKAEENAG